MNPTLRQGAPPLLALLLAALLGLGLLAPVPASAAPPYTTTASIDSLAFRQTSVVTSETVAMEGTWSLPDHPEGPAGFSLELPEGLRGRTDAFDLMSPDGTAMGRCVVESERMSCDFDQVYLDANPRDLHGTFEFRVVIGTRVTETQTVDYDFAEVEGSVSVQVRTTNVCQTGCEYRGTEGSKSSSYQYGADPSTDHVRWWITVPATPTGTAQDGRVTVTELPGDGLDIREGSILVQTATTMTTNPNGSQSPAYSGRVPASEVTITEDPLTISFDAQQGVHYRIYLITDVTDGGVQGTYENRAEITMGTAGTVEVSRSVTRQGGSGTGIGTNVGRFALTKEVTGTASIDEDLEYVVGYTVTEPGGTVHEETATLVAGEEFTSATYPRGSVVSLTEVRPTDATAYTWSDPVFSTNDFALVGGTETAVTLTNQATLQTGTFSAAKTLTGDATGTVPSDAEFVLEYTYPAGDGFPAGEGSLTLLADGTPVASEDLPLGAELTFTEATPADVPGATWGTAEISPSTLTIGADDQAPVTVTNPISLDTGSFQASKQVTGDAADRVADDTAFTLTYTYPADEELGFSAGSGSLTMLADGTVATSEDLPRGAVLTFDEATPAGIPGASWGEATIEPATLTIGAEDQAQVVVTNPITQDLGAFSVTKSLSGTGVSHVAEGTVFTVNYSYPADDSLGIEAGEGALEVTAGETTIVQGLPAGAVVTLTEVTAEDPTGATWGEPVFDHSTFTILQDNTVAIDLDNPVDLDTWTFALTKTLAGDGTDLVPAGQAFTVEYSYPAGQGYQAGGGTFTVQADGTAVTSDPLPWDATVTLTEATPDAVPGGTWTDAEFSQGQLAEDSDGTVIEVELTNTITTDEVPPTPTQPAQPTTPATPETPETPETPGTPGPGASVHTGGEATSSMPQVIGLALLLLGGTAVLLGVRHRRAARR